MTQGELSIATGIAGKNLSRFLGYDEFKGICSKDGMIAATGKVENQADRIEIV